MAIETPRHMTSGEPRGGGIEQPTPWSTPGRWTITTVDGTVTSGYLPAWAEDDPSEAGVPVELLPERLARIGHRSFFEGRMMDLATPGTRGRPEEEAVFEGSIDCVPYAVNAEARVPVVNIQVCPGHWLLGLDPDGVAQVAAQLRAQADLLADEVRPALAAAREDWAVRALTASPDRAVTDGGAG
jgi:hypothetical protein